MSDEHEPPRPPRPPLAGPGGLPSGVTPKGAPLRPRMRLSRPGVELRLVTDEPVAFHPLTTHGAPLLPPRTAPGARADVWEELDRAAAWVCDHHHEAAGEPAAGAAGCTVDAVRHTLRIVCVALRAAVQGGAPLRADQLPWQVPVAQLVGALRRRLVEQAADPGEALAPPPGEVLALVAALDRLEGAARADVARATVDQLTGPQALELLVEVAHDMRSPLGSILFLAERMRGSVDAPVRRQAALVYGAAYGLSAMVGDVMELARGGDRLATGDPAPFSLAQVVGEVRAIVQPLAEEKGLRLEVGALPPEPRVGHAAAVHRVLLNLVTNALKFTREGGVTVRAEGASGIAFVRNLIHN